MRELTLNEMEEVNGGVPTVVVGALIGAGSYAITSALSGGGSFSGFVGATLAGAVSGGFSVAFGSSNSVLAAGAFVGAGAGGAVHNAIDTYEASDL